MTPALVGRSKPIPTLRGVRVTGLCGIDHEAGRFLGNHIQARASGEIVGRLGIANEKVSLRLPADKADSNTAILPTFVFDFWDRELPDFRC